MERLIIDGDPEAVEAIPGSIVGKLWDLVHDFPLIISIYVEVDEAAIAASELDTVFEEPETQTVYGVDFGRKEPTNGNR